MYILYSIFTKHISWLCSTISSLWWFNRRKNVHCQKRENLDLRVSVLSWTWISLLLKLIDSDWLWVGGGIMTVFFFGGPYSRLWKPNITVSQAMVFCLQSLTIIGASFCFVLFVSVFTGVKISLCSSGITHHTSQILIWEFIFKNILQMT